MSKNEIMAELAHLSPQELAEVRAWLDGIAFDNAPASVGLNATAARLRSPRLADASKAADFRKQVMELSTDAAL